MEHPMNGALWQLQQRVMKNSYLGTTYPLLPGIRTSFFISFPSFVRHVQITALLLSSTKSPSNVVPSSNHFLYGNDFCPL